MEKAGKARGDLSVVLAHLAEGQLDRRLLADERHEHRQTLVCGVDLRDGGRHPGPGLGCQGHGVADLERRDRSGLRARGQSRRDGFGRRLGLDDRGEHADDFVLREGHGRAAVADESRHAVGRLHDSPGIVRQLHADEHVPGHAHAGDELALAAADLEDLLHRHFDLEDVVLHVHRVHADLEVLLDPLLVAGVGVQDVPAAVEALELGPDVVLGQLAGGGRGVPALRLRAGGRPPLRLRPTGLAGRLGRNRFGAGIPGGPLRRTGRRLRRRVLFGRGPGIARKGRSLACGVRGTENLVSHNIPAFLRCARCALCSMRADPPGLREDPEGQARGESIDDADEDHDDRDENDDGREHLPEFLARGTLNLLELGEDLVYEAHDAPEETEFFSRILALGLRSCLGQLASLPVRVSFELLKAAHSPMSRLAG